MKVCVVCGNQIPDDEVGLELQEDFVVSAIRRLKKLLGIEKGSTLVVCKKDLDAYHEKRKKFESLLFQTLFLSVTVFALFFVWPLLKGTWRPEGLVGALVLSFVFPVLAVFISYIPPPKGEKLGSDETGTGRKGESGPGPSGRKTEEP